MTTKCKRHITSAVVAAAGHVVIVFIVVVAWASKWIERNDRPISADSGRCSLVGGGLRETVTESAIALCLVPPKQGRCCWQDESCLRLVLPLGRSQERQERHRQLQLWGSWMLLVGSPPAPLLSLLAPACHYCCYHWLSP